MSEIGRALAEHACEHLFIECLGWDRLGWSMTIAHQSFTPREDFS